MILELIATVNKFYSLIPKNVLNKLKNNWERFNLLEFIKDDQEYGPYVSDNSILLLNDLDAILIYEGVKTDELSEIISKLYRDISDIRNL